MRERLRKDLVQQAKDFYKETRYAPSNYDALFHIDMFSSPVTIRKHFGSWNKYLDEALDVMMMNYNNKMFYGGYGVNYRISHTHELDPIGWVDGSDYDLLGKLTYDHLSPKEAWIVKSRWKSIIEVLHKVKLNFKLIPGEKKFLSPFVLIDDKYAIASFDTPHIKNHYKRTTVMIEYLNTHYSLLNLNGVKKNHVAKAIERLMK